MEPETRVAALALDCITEAIFLVIRTEDEALASRVVPILDRARLLLLERPSTHMVDIRDLDRVRGTRQPK